MCGIAGIYSFREPSETYRKAVENAIGSLRSRGPEHQSVAVCGNAAMGHARLAILDVSEAGNQPFFDASGRYCIVYNGEFYNYRDFYDELRADGVVFSSSSDTEVLLYLFIKYKEACLQKINGFFAFAVYDSYEDTLFVARDRMGIKPLLFTVNDEFFGFSSELKGIMEMPIAREVDCSALSLYLRLNYVPAPLTMVKGVEKLQPGMFLKVSAQGVERKRYYSLRQEGGSEVIPYADAQKRLRELLDDSVKKRLISDVPLGTFLSGGIDSSVVSTIASRYVDSLQTFSIGFKDNPYFDETHYARLVAKKIRSQHTEIQIDAKMLEDSLHALLSSIDEPFADSSAIAVHVLCRYVKPHVTVALSGDGADELFAGYRKHFAQHSIMQHRGLSSFASCLHPLLKQLPQSRSNAVFNCFRKIAKFSENAAKSTADCYWDLCCFSSEQDAARLLLDGTRVDSSEVKELYTECIRFAEDLNGILLADQNLVLPNDMLVKVDRMSMDSSLEVRTPFLDHRLVEFVNALPAGYKIGGGLQKRILQDAFRSDLPAELYNRSKKGFEVPLQAWNRTVFKDLRGELLSRDFVTRQGIFDPEAVQSVQRMADSPSPADSPMQIWALLVFQAWWKRYFL